MMERRRNGLERAGDISRAASAGDEGNGSKRGKSERPEKRKQ
jgi:hypothetical protein